MTGPTPDAIAARVRISRALGGMRYGGLVGAFAPSGRGYVVPGGEDEPPEAVWLDALAEWLEEFSSVLVRHADAANAEAKAFGRLKADVAAVRRVLGVDVADQLVAANAHIAATERAAGAS